MECDNCKEELHLETVQEGVVIYAHTGGYEHCYRITAPLARVNGNRFPPKVKA